MEDEPLGGADFCMSGFVGVLAFLRRHGTRLQEPGPSAPAGTAGLFRCRGHRNNRTGMATRAIPGLKEQRPFGLCDVPGSRAIQALGPPRGTGATMMWRPSRSRESQALWPGATA